MKANDARTRLTAGTINNGDASAEPRGKTVGRDEKGKVHPTRATRQDCENGDAQKNETYSGGRDPRREQEHAIRTPFEEGTAPGRRIRLENGVGNEV